MLVYTNSLGEDTPSPLHGAYVNGNQVMLVVNDRGGQPTIINSRAAADFFDEVIYFGAVQELDGTVHATQWFRSYSAAMDSYHALCTQLADRGVRLAECKWRGVVQPAQFEELVDA